MNLFLVLSCKYFYAYLAKTLADADIVVLILNIL